MAIEAKSGVLVVDVLVLSPDGSAETELLWDNDCLKY